MQTNPSTTPDVVDTSARRFEWPVRVYYEDTDAGGIVYYANYLRFMERARSEWLRAVDVDARRLRDDHGLMMVVTRAYVDYKSAARLDDQLLVSVVLERARRASFDLAQEVSRDAERLCTAAIRVACVSIAGHRPRPLPSSVLGALR